MRVPETKGTRHESQEVARLLMLEAKAPEALEPEQRRYLKELRGSCPELAAAQEVASRFARLVREGEEDGLAGWLRDAGESDLPEILTFARGIRQDEAAVRAAIREPWSNGQVEGQVNRLKMLKRQMYGRARPIEETGTRGGLTARATISRLLGRTYPRFTNFAPEPYRCHRPPVLR